MAFRMCMELDALATAETFYVNPGTTCWLVDAYTSLFTVIDTTDTTITMSDGTTTIGTITITASGVAEGDCDKMAASDLSVELNTTTPLKIVCGGESGSTGDAMLTLVFDEMHGGAS